MRSLLVGALALVAAAPAWPHSVTVDGDTSDWGGTPSAVAHDVTVSDAEWIYTGRPGDMNPNPSGDVESNGDITEVRFTADSTYLYVLVRLRDVTDIREPYIAIGFEEDDNPSDSNGLNFLGDESGVDFPSQQAQVEYNVTIHNATDPTTRTEFFHDAGGGTWYTPLSEVPGSGNIPSFISTTNDLVEARIPLADVNLTLASAFRVSLVTFDNNDQAEPPLVPAGVGFNEDRDTTVDYIPNDSVDVMAGAPGSTDDWLTRGFISGTQLTASYLIDLGTVPTELSVLTAD
jgi:hypothetical protein